MHDDSNIDILVIDEAPRGVLDLKLDIGASLPDRVRWTDIVVLARGENVGVEDLDRMKLDKGREFNAYAEFEEPDFEEVDENRTAEILRAAMRIVSNCERRVRALARQHNVPADVAPRTGSSWQPPEDVRDSMRTSYDTRPAKQTTPSEQDRGAPPAATPHRDREAARRSSAGTVRVD